MNSYITGYKDDYYIFKLATTYEKHIECMQLAFNHLYKDNYGYKLYTYDGYINLGDDASKLFELYTENDVLSIDRFGIVYEQYSADDDDNALVLTLQCNSNCVMCPCSERSRRESQLCSLDELQERLRYMPTSVPFLTITGGEPTLLKEDFFGLLKTLQEHFVETQFLLLTNGRAFGDYYFTQRFVECLPDNIRVGIPLYGYDEETHDKITQTPGSFKQAVIGIHNLLHYNIETEIRIVLTKQNIDYITHISRYIVKYFSGVCCVNIMGLEMLGNAAKNMNDVWLPYKDLINRAESAIKFLIQNGVNIQLYNFPLCTVPKAYWGICAKSISGYKVRFSDECADCAVQSICGGIFESTKRMTKFTGVPIQR